MKIENLVIVTGMSGAGKTSFLNSLEDLGYLTLNNIPASFCRIIFEQYNFSREYSEQSFKIAIGIGVRSKDGVEEYKNFLKFIEQNFKNYEIIFLDAADDIIIKRYTLTRRKHPMDSYSILEGIKKEREIMSEVMNTSTRIIDTSHINNKILLEKIKQIEQEKGSEFKELTIHLQSFGYKYGMPIDLDLVFDLRFLRNPYYEAEL
ncbi:MAG: RNase adapter RapZ, partial [Fusobacteriaceae bacterium]